jgi:hypothetical protein
MVLMVMVAQHAGPPFGPGGCRRMAAVFTMTP